MPPRKHLLSEKSVDIYQFGQMAEAVWPEFQPIIKSKRELALARLKFLYQSQKTDPSLYIAEVAIITCLDDLIMSVDRSIRLSREKQKELLDGSPNGPN